MEITATFIDWKIEDVFGMFRIVGRIAGEDAKGRFESGDVIYTSALKSIDFENGVAVTRNSVYKLVM